MEFSVEILDHIFSFLVSHRTLVDCSRDPVLSPIVERQLYYHTTVHFAGGWHGYERNFEADHFSTLVSHNPCILNYVRILEIRVELGHNMDQDSAIAQQLDSFAETLCGFPFLECIMLNTSKNRTWYWPDVFRDALETRLKLPSVKEVHLVGNQEFPFSLIGNCKNVENLLLAGYFEAADGEDSTPLTLKSLTLANIGQSLRADELHISKLQSLKCAELDVDNLSALLEVCSETLNKLDIDLTYSKYATNYSFQTSVSYPATDLELPSVPNLRQLTIRAPVLVENEVDEDYMFTPKRSISYLPAVADIIKSLDPPPRHLLLDINIHLFEFSFNLANVDFSPLTALGDPELSIPRIDLYVHTGIVSSDVTHTHLLASLGECNDTMRAIEKDILFIHPERTAPGYVED